LYDIPPRAEIRGRVLRKECGELCFLLICFLLPVLRHPVGVTSITVWSLDDGGDLLADAAKSAVVSASMLRSMQGLLIAFRFTSAPRQQSIEQSMAIGRGGENDTSRRKLRQTGSPL
jgi:hypothetical protein